MTRRAIGVLCVLGLGLSQVAAQAPEAGARKNPSTVQQVLGEVTGVDGAARQISIKTDAGEPAAVTTDDSTSFVRTEPGARDLSNAVTLTLTEISVGDRLLARGRVTGDGKTLAARQVVIMGRSDIARKLERERSEWRTRGVSGVISALEPARAEVTVETRSLAGSQKVVVATADRKAVFKRYAPGSVRFSDAVPSSFAELQVGDQVRVLGERTPDGAKVVADQIVSGSFEIVSGAVKSVARREVTIKDNETGEALVVSVGSEAMVRRLPPDLAARLARRSRPGTGRTESAGSEAPGPSRPKDGATLQDMLEGLPAMPIEELRPGDQIAVSSPSRTPGHLIAAVLLAGIEPLLESRSRRAAGGGDAVGLAPGALDLGVGVP